MSQVCLVIPCFNEQTRLRGREILAFLDGQPLANVLFVDDGSSDGTLALVESLRVTSPEKVDVLPLATNVGKAEAVRQGVIRAARSNRFDFIGYWDADLSTPLSELSRFVQVLESDPARSFVIGSRLKRLGSRVERRLTRHVLGRLFAVCTSLVLNLPVYDSQCGAKLFRRDIVSVLFGQPFLSRWFFDVELLARLRNHLGRDASLDAMFELPVAEWIEVDGTKLRVLDLLKVPIEIFRIGSHYNRRR